MTVFLKRVLSVLKCMSLRCARKMTYLLQGFAQLLRAEDAAIDSTGKLCLANLALFTCMLLLSPDKIPQMLGSTKSGLATLDLVEEILALLKRIIPL